MTKQEQQKLKIYIEMWFESRKEINKTELKNKFLEYQKSHGSFFSDICGTELIQIAEKAGFKIKGYKKPKDIIIVKNESYIKSMSKEELENLYTKNELSITDIAEMYGLKREKVKELLERYGIKKVERTIPKEKLENIYNNHNIKKACEILNIAESYMYKLLDHYKIKKKGRKGEVA